VTQDRAIKETWADFGMKMEKFLDNHGEELKDFDILIGFTRGGMILASILCTLLRDRFPDVARDKSYFGSLRPLPGGITVKTYRDPCFVVGTPMCKEEEDDAEILIGDIERFKKTYRTSQKKLRLLLVDDNLTGATRMFAYKEFLSKRLNFLDVRTLAYTRLECFRHPSLDFIIAGYTPADKYFVMPWHTKHGLLDLPSADVPMINLVLRGQLEFDKLYHALEAVTGNFGMIGIETNGNIRICRGASVIYIGKKENSVTMRFLLSKYYPPKACLESKLIKNVNTFGEYSLCNLGAVKADRICFTCSSLNCNRDILRMVFGESLGSHIEVEQARENAKKSILLTATERWLEKFLKSPITV